MFATARGPILYAANPPAAPASGWNLATATADNKSFALNSQDTVPRGLYVKGDGTKFWIAGDNNNRIYQYSLSTANDISSATYDNKNVSVNTQDTAVNDVFFSSDGTKMYIAGNTNDTIYQYTLTTAWDVSTASYANKSKLVSDSMNDVFGIFFKPDGTKMYICGTGVAEYSLSTAWDVSTASFTIDKSTSSQDSLPTQVWFKDDGTRMFIIGNSTDKIYQYNLSTAWSVSSATYSNVSFTPTTTGLEEGWNGLAFNSNGTKMWAVGIDLDTAYQYSLTS